MLHIAATKKSVFWAGGIATRNAIPPASAHLSENKQLAVALDYGLGNTAHPPRVQ
jgi:hypothetical protein